MIHVRKSAERGHFNFGWLDTHHSFSFGEYHDPRFMGFSALRVINEDTVAAGHGFPTHPHRDMEIVTYILEGALEHKDSLGTGSVIRPGEVQRMSAGKGVLHSEFNPSQDEAAHLLQIWIEPNVRGIAPGYEQKTIDAATKRGKLRLVAANEPGDAAVKIHADAALYAGLFDAGERAELALAPGRKGYVHLVRGELEVNGERLAGGDALMLADEPRIAIANGKDAEVLVFDLAA